MRREVQTEGSSQEKGPMAGKVAYLLHSTIVTSGKGAVDRGGSLQREDNRGEKCGVRGWENIKILCSRT